MLKVKVILIIIELTINLERNNINIEKILETLFQ
jgi:hypothetical protein